MSHGLYNCVTWNTVLSCLSLRHIVTFTIDISVYKVYTTSLVKNTKEVDMFDYTNATDEEMLNQVLTASAQIVSMARKYHLEQKHPDIVQKIDTARLHAKFKRAEIKLEQMRKQYESQDNTPT